MKVIVVGGGASGIIAAIKASEYADVTIIESNNKLAKKILVTGNGKCNFWNKSINVTNYNNEAKLFLEDILRKKDEVFNFLTNNLGITYTTKGDFLYPYSKSASSVSSSLIKEIEKRKIDVLYNIKVNKISVENNSITLALSDNTIIRADKIIIACGSKAASKTGSDGSGYKLLEDIGVNIESITPALVPLVIDNEETSLWAGVRTDAKLSLYKNDNLIKEESGEIQLTDYGISGIVTFNISSLVSSFLNNNENFTISIDFLPELNNIEELLDNKSKKMNAKTLEELFETIFNYKLFEAILKRAKISKNESWEKMDLDTKRRLISTIKEYKVNVIDTLDFEKAQVCHGGVSLEEIDETFALKKYKNIKVVGELLNVDGECGGYNLAFAFISGYIGGSEIND